MKRHKKWIEIILDKVIYFIGFVLGLILLGCYIVHAVNHGDPGFFHWVLILTFIVYFGTALLSPDDYEQED